MVVAEVRTRNAFAAPPILAGASKRQNADRNSVVDALVDSVVDPTVVDGEVANLFCRG